MDYQQVYFRDYYANHDSEFLHWGLLYSVKVRGYLWFSLDRKFLGSGMVDFEKIVNTEIEIYRIEIFFLISKSVFTESVFEICNFDFDIKSIISKFYKSI